MIFKEKESLDEKKKILAIKHWHIVEGEIRSQQRVLARIKNLLLSITHLISIDTNLRQKSLDISMELTLVCHFNIYFFFSRCDVKFSRMSVICQNTIIYQDALKVYLNDISQESHRCLRDINVSIKQKRMQNLVKGGNFLGATLIMKCRIWSQSYMLIFSEWHIYIYIYILLVTMHYLKKRHISFTLVY